MMWRNTWKPASIRKSITSSSNSSNRFSASRVGGVPDLSGLLTITFNNSTVSFGAILNALINFLLVGVAVYFCVILPINKLRDLTAAQDEADAEEQGPSVEEQTLATLQEIRDELKKANNSAE